MKVLYNRLSCKLGWVGSLVILTLSATAVANDKQPISAGLDAKNTSNHSAQNREQKQATMAVGGGLMNLAFRQSFLAGYFLDSGNLVEGGFGQAQLSVGGIGTHSKDFFGQLKHFWSNSFYSNIGLSFIKQISNSSFSILDGFDARDTYSVNRIALFTGIGNRWQFDSFTIGCDWVGYGIGISKSNETFQLGDSSSASFAQQDSIQERRDNARNESLRNQLYLLNLHMGASF